MREACIAEPISWLRLERHVLGPRDPGIDAHVEACAACRTCLAEIRGDLVVLRPLALPAPTRARRRWWLPAFGAGLAAAATLVALVVRRPVPAENVVAVKGGELVLGLIRARDGAISDDATTFRPGDRWKVVLTCPPGAVIGVRVEVFEVGGPSAAPDHPLADAPLVCGNRIALPGAFALTGTSPNRVCVRIDDEATACVTIRPER
ncbi:MAG: hypothetical protein NT062_23455 [Proteobacteria bacterium]|nr:hypothetical protein [Pseudomonadota bacterium]